MLSLVSHVPCRRLLQEHELGNPRWPWQTPRQIRISVDLPVDYFSRELVSSTLKVKPSEAWRSNMAHVHCKSGDYCITTLRYTMPSYVLPLIPVESVIYRALVLGWR